MNLPGTRMIYKSESPIGHSRLLPYLGNVSLMQATDHSLFGLTLNDHTLEPLQEMLNPELSMRQDGALNT